jgi:thiol:disulfide interchange protein DsbD
MTNRLPRNILALLLGLLALAPVAATALTPQAPQATQASRPPLPVNEVFRLDVGRVNGGAVAFTWTILPGHYLYRDRISVAADGGKILPVRMDPGEIREDPNFGTTQIYRDKARAILDASDAPQSGTIRVSYQGCAAQGICYPPVTKAINLVTLAVADDKRDLGDAGSAGAAGAAADKAGVDTGTGTGSGSGPGVALSGSLPAMLATFLGFGLLLSLTPCVFPMIPILSGMLARSGERLSAWRGFTLSGAYVLAMALAYSAVGVAAAWSGQNLQNMLQTPVAWGLLSLVFAALALSMFGLFDLELPAAWTARLSGKGAKGNGSVGGAALLGFGSALVVGPCVTPPLAAALLYVAQTGDVARGAAALFALGLGMGLPLVVFGTFGGRLLPKSGPWLVTVKKAFGFVFLGLAVWMLGRVLSVAWTRALWGALAAACGIWLAMPGVSPRRGHPVGRMVLRVAGSAAGLCGLLLMAAAVGGGVPDPLRLAAGPGSTESDTAPGTVPDTDMHAGFFRKVSTPEAFDEALAEARAQGRPILVDFTAGWCIVCREIDATVMADPKILPRLKNVSIIRADITASTGESRSLMRRFAVVGPPTMLFVDPRTGREIDNTRTIGAVTADTFGRELDQAGA